MQDIPLKVLIVDPADKSSSALAEALSHVEIVLHTEKVHSLEEARGVIEATDINTIYIDPISLDLALASNFIFNLRREKPVIVFVLYMDFIKLRDLGDASYTDERSRLNHYFRLDKLTPAGDFDEKVKNTIRRVQDDLSYNLTQDKIISLQQELKSLQEGATSDSVGIPAKVLREIQEQLSARRSDIAPHGAEISAAEFLGRAEETIDLSKCFVVMPYSEKWSESVEHVIRKVCLEVGFQFEIAKTMDGRYIPNDIWRGITGSGIIIGDLTSGNPNVTYEIGLADALGREVILICQSSAVPFDFAGQRLVLYENSIGGGDALREKLLDRLQKLKDEDEGKS